MMRRRGVRPAAALAGCLLLAACGSGESILQAGNDTPAATTPVPDDTTPGQTTVPTIPPTTLPAALDELPPCKPEALGDGPVTITFWHGLSNELGRELERLTQQFNDSQDRVRVNLEFQGGYEQTIDKYLQSSPENRPDMVQTPEYALQLMIDTESTVPIQSCIEASGYDTSDFIPAALSAYATEGVQWTIPYNVSNPVLFYNKKYFRDAGLDPDDPPLTLDEVSEVGRAMQATGAAAYGLAIDTPPDGGGGWFLEQWLGKEGELYSDNDNGRSAPSTRVLWDGPVAVDIMTELYSVITDGGGIYVGENPSGQDTLLKLADQTAPASMAISTSAALGPVLSIVDAGTIPGVTADDIGIGPMPSPSGNPGATIGGASLWIVAGKGDDRAAAAWEYIQFLLSPQAQSEWAAATGYVPVREAALTLDPIKTLYEQDPRFRVAFDQLEESPDGPASSGPVLGPLREVRVVAAKAMGEIMLGADPQTSLSAAAATANQLVSSYNASRPSD
jgi:sn-glycerol 3-phosphate transport system substrate-binding protein